MLAMIAILFFSTVHSTLQAQDDNAFTVAQQEILQCLESAGVEGRKGCYAVCESIKEPDLVLQCSRFKVSNEKEFLSELFSEEGKEGQVKSFFGMTLVQCRLMNLRGRAETELNDCLAELYFRKIGELLNGKEELAAKR